MGNLIKLTGLVLSVTNVGDFDRRLVLLTRERGKIATFVKGARRPNSPFVAVCSPFIFGQFSLYEGRTSYNVQSVEVSNYFSDLKKDLESVYFGMYFCEFADYLTSENNDEMLILKLLYQSLRALENKKLDRLLVRYIYEIKIMDYYGQGMQVFTCNRCGSAEELRSFFSGYGGILCDQCAKIESGGLKIQESTLYTLQYIMTSTIEKLYTFTVSKPVLRELQHITKQYLLYYVDHNFKTDKFL